MSKIKADYYLGNENARIAALQRRVAALERSLGIVPPRVSPQEGASMAMPDALLPSAAEIAPWLIVDRVSGGIYRVEGEVAAGKFWLHFIYMGQTREEAGE